MLSFLRYTFVLILFFQFFWEKFTSFERWAQRSVHVVLTASVKRIVNAHPTRSDLPNANVIIRQQQRSAHVVPTADAILRYQRSVHVVLTASVKRIVNAHPTRNALPNANVIIRQQQRSARVVPTVNVKINK
jgi:hypothetical protein